MPVTRRLPLLVACLGFAASSAVAATPDPLKSLDIDRLVERTMAAYQVPGIAVGIVKDGNLVFAKGYGVRELGLPRTSTSTASRPPPRSNVVVTYTIAQRLKRVFGIVVRFPAMIPGSAVTVLAKLPDSHLKT